MIGAALQVQQYDTAVMWCWSRGCPNVSTPWLSNIVPICGVTKIAENSFVQMLGELREFIHNSTNTRWCSLSNAAGCEHTCAHESNARLPPQNRLVNARIIAVYCGDGRVVLS